MRFYYVMLMALAIAYSTANPTRKCNRKHLLESRLDEPVYYVFDPNQEQYPFGDSPVYQASRPVDLADAQIQARVPQTQTAPTTTSIFGIGSIPTFGTLPSFTTLFPVSGTKCTTNSGDEGTCLSQSECDNQGGIKDGDCGTVLFRSAGVCCSFMIKKCSETAIRSPLMWMTPSRASSKQSCTLTFPANPGIRVAGTTIGGGLTSSSNSIRSCQIKVEFENFRLAPPNPNTTICDEDYFAAVGSTTPSQKLCGDSFTDQHLYLTFNEEQDDITLGFFLTDAANKDWKLRITRIPCSSQDLAPANCLQYLTKTAGSIESFNFKQEYGGSVRQLADQNYNICFKRPSGYCGVCFAPCQTFKNVPGFLLTKSAENATSATSGSNCPDQLIIPGGTNGGNVRESVYCGAALNPAKNATSDAPICTTSDRITYITDAKEAKDEVNNVGFCLTYTQKKC
ncbi:Uncharacterized protein APZ42_020444 [Daphnia magna]|uniref:Uncharacterized protein n=2 Tax=Daphnia magna TaxID=35525 RepID=A0ABQ9YRH7_9CRUS|nr:hypothetical protein OUZ56_005005 [Daphnia magna]KZS14270.1 Uncharacterized protein APZ42_020444 [Daphnia magna]